MHKIRPTFVCASGVLTVAIGLMPAMVEADVLYGVSFLTHELITIDTSTGAGSLVGPLDVIPGFGPAVPFALGEHGGGLYAYISTTNSIRQLDPATGATLVSISSGIPAFTEGGMDFRSDGLGFVTGGLFGPLYQVDITVPSSTTIGNTNVTFDGLAFDANDVLYGLSSADLYTIDPTTAAISLVGGLGVGGGIGGLDFRSDGVLFAAIGSSPSGPSWLYTIDATTGAATLVGEIGFSSVSGLAFIPSGSQLVPEPSSCALLLIGIAGMRFYGRRRVARVKHLRDSGGGASRAPRHPDAGRCRMPQA